MLSWKTIRSATTILLLIPVLHLVFLVASEFSSMINTSPSAWADEVDAYMAADRLTQLEEDPIVIVGGRQVLLWQGVEEILAPRKVLMRGLGDATVNDIAFYYEKVVSFYNPKTVVLLPGITEFHLRDNKSADELVTAIRQLVDMDLKVRPSGKFYIFSPLHSMLYPGDKTKIEEVSQQLQLWANSDARVRVLDANQLLSGKDGAARPAYYRSDGVNLNELGQYRLTMLLLAQLKEDGFTALDPL
jgi:lysophospholipase L1-like esterase